MKVCYACQSIFASADHLRKHEKDSAMHKENTEKIKLAQNTLLLWILGQKLDVCKCEFSYVIMLIFDN